MFPLWREIVLLVARKEVHSATTINRPAEQQTNPDIEADDNCLTDCHTQTEETGIHVLPPIQAFEPSRLPVFLGWSISSTNRSAWKSRS